MFAALVIDFAIFALICAVIILGVHVLSTLYYLVRGFRCQALESRRERESLEREHLERDDYADERCAVCGGPVGYCDY